MKPTRTLLFAAVLPLLSACSSTSVAPIDLHHPASTEAAEASTRPLRPMLRPDGATQRTEELIAQREREAEEAAAAPTSSGAQIAPRTKKAGHEHH